ncbi:hypothetical protein BKA70DRAFT_1455591 [Coprinopsis sp. MPI-PUGE-AT-0042]|nr:hypothetical protein BKA70DRAFT_1455591 [Coprinopsis sp. MPI-PUGE-AT-0042]
MAAIPYADKPVGNKVAIHVPRDWFVTVSAVKKNYVQGVYVGTNIRRGTSAMFYSDAQSQGPMEDAVFTRTSFPINPRTKELEILLEISAFFSETGAIGASELRQGAQYKSNALDIHVSKKDEDAAKEIPDYVTFTIFVEDTSDEKQVKGSGKYDDSVVIVHLVKTNPNVIPPPPPPDTQKGYNPVLDLPRPSTLENYLREYDVVFLIDDSGSMKGDRWTEAGNALNNLANWIIDHGWDSDGIDLRFLNHQSTFSFRTELVNGVQDKGKVGTAIAAISPDGGTPTGKRTRELLDAHLAKLNAARNTDAYGKIKPLDLICITDGEANDDPAHELGKMIEEVVAALRVAPPHHPNSMGVQFVQIGGDAAAAAALDKLTKLNHKGMVDTVPYAGPGSISGDKLERILLGGLHPNVRAQKTP